MYRACYTFENVTLTVEFNKQVGFNERNSGYENCLHTFSKGKKNVLRNTVARLNYSEI